MNTTTVRSLLLAAGVIATGTGSAMAQDSTAASAPSQAAASPSRWNWVVEPYLLVPTMSGTSGVHGLTADVTASSSDIFGALDFGAMLYVETHNDQWAFALDWTYTDLGQSGPVAVDLSDEQNRIDPYLGTRLTLPRKDKWRFGFNGFIGGFGVGSDFAWQVFPNLGYQFNKLFELNGSYRAIYMDYKHGSGIEQFTYKMTTYGPQLGGMFHC